MQAATVKVTLLPVVVVLASVVCLTNGLVLKCYQCDGKDNKCDEGANMTLVECGGTCYRMRDHTRTVYHRKCYPFKTDSSCPFTNNSEDECYCNHSKCNDKCCDSAHCCEDQDITTDSNEHQTFLSSFFPSASASSTAFLSFCSLLLGLPLPFVLANN